MNRCCYNCAFYNKLCYMPNETVLDECCDVCTLDFHMVDDAYFDVCEAFSDNKGSGATDNYHTLLRKAYETLIKKEG
ncbi:MAG: hypothetical protein OSJ43_11650 [Oscillospiraceae bacterium]|nr:hypothetical protein [Oscillospiraceae bacterium]